MPWRKDIWDLYLQVLLKVCRYLTKILNSFPMIKKYIGVWLTWQVALEVC